MDKKSDAAKFSHLVPKVRLFDSVYRVHWASFSYVLATLYLLRQAFEDKSNTHFYLMSGQCFPVKTDEEIAALLDAVAGNFISMFKMPVSHKPLSRLTDWHFHDARAVGIDNDALKRIAQRIFNRLPKRNVIKTLRGMQPYGGSTWWLLNRETVSVMLKFLDNNRWYLNAFKWSFVPEEMFFQTLVAHLGISPERMSPTFAKWIEGAAHPLTVDHAILYEAKASWHLMARKFDAVFD